MLFSAPSKETFSIVSNNISVCPSCYQLLQPDNHRVRLRPKQRPPARVHSVLRRKARGKRLNLVQKYLLHRFQNSSSVLVRSQNTTTPHTGLRVVLYCTALQHVVLAENHLGLLLNCVLSYSGELGDILTAGWCSGFYSLILKGFLGQMLMSLFNNNTCWKTV